jgi:hypothetical protein
MNFYFYTKDSNQFYISTVDTKVYKFHFYTKKAVKIHFYTRPIRAYKFHFYTTKSKNFFFVTQSPLPDPYPLSCKYPSILEKIRDAAVKLYYSISIGSLRKSIHAELYGKKCSTGYLDVGHLRILVDFLSSIYLEKEEDAKSGLVRTATFYYDKYKINDIIVNFRKCNINIKPIVDLFNLKTYEIIDDNWPNYFLINTIIKPPTPEVLKKLKQFTDIYTSDAITADPGQAVQSIFAARTSFPLTKTLKYLSSFSINGSDYIAYADYNETSVTYVPSILGYTISGSDTVTITYWYEE